MQRFFEKFVSQLEVRIKDSDQASFYKHLKGMDFEGKKPCSSHYIKDAEGSLLRDMGLIRNRWVQWFSTLLNTKSPALDPNIVEELKVRPRAHLSMTYLRSLRWRKPSRACQTESLLDPMSSRLNCSNSP